MGLRTITESKPLTAEQQELVMQYYTLTRGLGSKFTIPKTSNSKRANKLRALKLTMQQVGIPGELIYGDTPTTTTSVPSSSR